MREHGIPECYATRELTPHAIGQFEIEIMDGVIDTLLAGAYRSIMEAGGNVVVFSTLEPVSSPNYTFGFTGWFK
jgi:hypothetical protein